MRSTFTPEARGAVLQGLYAGLTLAEAIERAGLPEQTVKAWLTRGRKDPESEHGRFAAAVDEAREVAARADLSLPEFKGFLNKAVRGGSIAAMRLWLEVYDREQDEPDDPFAALDAAANGHGDGSVFDQLAHKARGRPNRHDRLDAGLEDDDGE